MTKCLIHHHGLAWAPLIAIQRPRKARKPSNISPRLGLNHIQPAVRPSLTRTPRLNKISTIHQQVPFWPPRPRLPHTLRRIVPVGYLPSSRVWRRYEPIPLAYNRWMLAPTNCIHQPMSIVIINHMEEPPSAPWHSLHQPFTKMVKCHGHLHDGVPLIWITCTKQHHVVVMREMGVWHCDSCGALDCVYEPILAVWHGEMVQPNVGWPKDWYAIAIAYGS